MSGELLQRKVTITNPTGFHMRPQTAFAQLAQQFQAAVSVVKDERRANGKSPFELLLLSVPCGTELTLEAVGPDAEQALEALAGLLAISRWEEDSDTPLPPKG
jgi:phosphotransferase system HPr (HPr) family protein